ncbi:MAG: ATP-binding protein [Deltaproteobacteria bacterium]
MFDLKLRETNILKIIGDSLLRLSPHDHIAIKLKSFLDDETMWIDHEQMVTCFSDLEQNAIEAMPVGGLLTITVEGDKRHVAITLSDTGAGITEENIPLLFTPFFTTKQVGDGTGLGLPQAYATVKAHRGEISIESNADAHKCPTGTTVRISMPRRLFLQDKQGKMIVHQEE